MQHVNAGDLVAMQAHETPGGWEDLRGGGDRDYNDFVVQIDFTSAAGHGWLA